MAYITLDSKVEITPEMFDPEQKEIKDILQRNRERINIIEQAHKDAANSKLIYKQEATYIYRQ